eukprot:jgi/Orpsp1_1/1183769/evm.model.c7180000086659.1
MKVNYNYAFDYLTNNIIIQNLLVTDNNNNHRYSEKLSKTSHNTCENVTHSVESSSLLEWKNSRYKFIEYNTGLINNDNIYYQLIDRKLNNIPDVKMDDHGKLYADKKNNKIQSMTCLTDIDMEKIYNLNLLGNKYTFLVHNHNSDNHNNKYNNGNNNDISSSNISGNRNNNDISKKKKDIYYNGSKELTKYNKQMVSRPSSCISSKNYDIDEIYIHN